MASELDAISAVYDAPLLALREGRAIHLSDRTAVRHHLRDVMAAYSRSGAAEAEIAALDRTSTRATPGRWYRSTSLAS